VPLQTIVAGLEEFQPFVNRLRIVEVTGGIKVINDTYNANPDSVRAALATLVELAGERRKVVVLGDMLELGRHSVSSHQAIGGEAERLGCDFLFSVGEFAKRTVEGAREAGMEPRRAKDMPGKDDLVDHIRKLLVLGELEAGDWILVKGSRGMRMETVIEDLAKPI
jgi:UDP-N-acetylmuramyl pentapeptide synthase